MKTFIWDWATARHLLARAGFGGRSAEVKRFVSIGMHESVNELLAHQTRSFPVPNWLNEQRQIQPARRRKLDDDARRQRRREHRQYVADLNAGLLQYMIHTPTPADMLHSRMMWFWVSHFPVSAKKVKFPPFLYYHLKTCHDNALGNYGDVLHAMIRDPAMLRYLDNIQNHRRQPNENLARELMELFSLGPEHYTEHDIRDGARALTGWSVRPYQFTFIARQHDYGRKRILGHNGRFDGDDFVNIILQHDACSVFMVTKLWHYFAGTPIPPDVVTELSTDFRQAKYDIRALLEKLFTHPAFYDTAAIGTQIRSPVQLVVGTTRLLNLTTPSPMALAETARQMGQSPLHPPNVKGWPGGRSWINTTTLLTRYSFVESLATSDAHSFHPMMRGIRSETNGSLNYDPRAIVDTTSEAPGDIVDHTCRVLMPLPPTSNERERLIERFKSDISSSHETALRRLIGDVMLLPGFQLC